MRKNVQYHNMLRHILLGLEQEAPVEYGTHFTMHKAYFGTCIDTKVYIVEPFLNDTFTKIVNNDGSIKCIDSTLKQKAEAFVHYSYKALHKPGIVVDIQGVGYQLTDPEIACKEEFIKEKGKLFGGDNLRDICIDNLFQEHKCNTYCIMLNLEDNVA